MIADEHGGGESSDENIAGEIRAKANGIIAGTSVVDRLVVQHFPDCTVTLNVTEGEDVQSVEQLLNIS